MYIDTENVRTSHYILEGSVCTLKYSPNKHTDKDNFCMEMTFLMLKTELGQTCNFIKGMILGSRVPDTNKQTNKQTKTKNKICSAWK